MALESRRYRVKESDLAVVLRWWLAPEQRVDLWIFACTACVLLAMSAAMALWGPPSFLLSEDAKREPQVEGLVILATMAYLALGTLLARTVRRKARDIRLGLDGDNILYVEHHRLSLERKFKERVKELEREREEWQDKKTAEIYETILGQMESGILKPRDDDGESYDFPRRDW